MLYLRLMKKKTRRQFKKIAKTLQRAWKQYGLPLDSRGLRALGGLGGSSLLVAAAADPQIRQSAQALALAVRDFLARAALGERSDAGARARSEASDEGRDDESLDEDAEDGDRDVQPGSDEAEDEVERRH